MWNVILKQLEKNYFFFIKFKKFVLKNIYKKSWMKIVKNTENL